MMKMKCLFVFMAFCIMAGSVNAASVYPVQSGNWADAATWGTYGVPLNSSGDEFKLLSSVSSASNDMVLTINSNVGNYTAAKFDIARATTVEIQTDGYIGVAKEFRVADAGATGNGGAQSDDGFVNQTGGQLDLTATGKLGIGWKAFASGTLGGIYTISGGSMTGATGTQVLIGCAGAAGSVGKLKIVGDDATISMSSTLYIANASATSNSNLGSGTAEFKLDATGAVSRMQVLKTVIDSQDAEDAVASLLVDMTVGTATGDVVLIENTGADAVVGAFDTLNRSAAVEGSVFEIGSGWFKLTYNYAAGTDLVGNDIALIMVPEPATLAILGLGGLLLRRRFA